MSATDVLAEHQYGETSDAHCLCGHEEPLNDNTDMAAHQLDALRAAGYAVVKLPESSHTDDSDTVFWGDSIPVRVRWSNDIVVDNHIWIRSAEARSLAAALLAAEASGGSL